MLTFSWKPQSFYWDLSGNTGYVRQRSLEFSLKDVPRTTLIQQVEDTMNMIEQTLNHLSKADLERDYPIIVFQKK